MSRPSCIRRAGSALEVVALVAAVTRPPPTRAAPPEGTEWVPFAAMTDEFNGNELDRSKWYDHNPTWRGRQPVQFHPDCVEVRDGRLRITKQLRQISSDMTSQPVAPHVDIIGTGFL